MLICGGTAAAVAAWSLERSRATTYRVVRERMYSTVLSKRLRGRDHAHVQYVLTVSSALRTRTYLSALATKRGEMQYRTVTTFHTRRSLANV